MPAIAPAPIPSSPLAPLTFGPAARKQMITT